MKQLIYTLIFAVLAFTFFVVIYFLQSHPTTETPSINIDDIKSRDYPEYVDGKG